MKLADPGLVCYVFFDKAMRRAGHRDQCQAFARAFGDYCDKFHLTERPGLLAPNWQVIPPDEELHLLSLSGTDFEVWLGRELEEKGFHSFCLGYTYRDALVLQAAAIDSTEGKAVDPWPTWLRLKEQMDEVLQEGDLAGVGDGVWGVTYVFCGLLPPEGSDMESVNSLGDLEGIPDLAHQGCLCSPHTAQTAAGHLWLIASNHGDESHDDPYRDSWILLTPPPQEGLAGQFLSTYADQPGEFALLALTRHKFYVQFRVYRRRSEELHSFTLRLGLATERLGRIQEDEAGRLDVTGSREVSEFQTRQARLLRDFAALQEQSANVEVARNTLEVNRNNFEQLTRAMGIGGDLLEREVAMMGQRSQQLAYEVTYLGAWSQRVEAAIEAAQRRLEIFQARQSSQEVRLEGIQASGVIAGLTGLILATIFQETDVLRDHWLLAANLIMFAWMTTFGLAQSVIHWGRLRTDFDRYAWGLAGGFAATSLMAGLFEASWGGLEGWAMGRFFGVAPVAFLPAFYLASKAFSGVEGGSLRRRQEGRRETLRFGEALEALRKRYEEVDELLSIEPSPQPGGEPAGGDISLTFVIPPEQSPLLVRRLVALLSARQVGADHTAYRNVGGTPALFIPLGLSANAGGRDWTLRELWVLSPGQRSYLRASRRLTRLWWRLWICLEWLLVRGLAGAKMPPGGLGDSHQE